MDELLIARAIKNICGDKRMHLHSCHISVFIRCKQNIHFSWWISKWNKLMIWEFWWLRDLLSDWFLWVSLSLFFEKRARRYTVVAVYFILVYPANRRIRLTLVAVAVQTHSFKSNVVVVFVFSCLVKTLLC